jgi:integrase
MINGKRHCVNLGVKLVGTPPASLRLRDEGDAAFERSRGTAEARLAELAEEARSVRDSARLVEKLYSIKTGAKVRSVRLEDLETEWATLPRKREVAGKYAVEAQRTLGRFVAFVRSRNRKAEELDYVDAGVAAAFMRAEKERGISARTWNATLKLLRSVFRHLLPSGAPNPFDRLVTREEATVFRQPFTPAELKGILEAAKGDEFIQPIIITGMCTAMRRGDCCQLRWQDVDLRGGFVTVKTAKTGGTVSIPIFGLLRDELIQKAEKAEVGRQKTEANDTSPRRSPQREPKGRGHRLEGYVFPKQAAMYGVNPDGITRRVKRVLWAALAGGATPVSAAAEVSTEEVRKRGETYLARLSAGERRERMRRVFGLYMDGSSAGQVAKGTGVSQGSVSVYLNEIEAAIGCKVLRWRAGVGGIAKAVKADSSVLRSERAEGLRRASVRDFHSLRVTWVTLALTAGVPLELVQRVTGHKTTDVVLKHYFRPGQEDFRLALEGAMPKLLTTSAGAVTAVPAAPRQELREAVERLATGAVREALLRELDRPR